MAYSNDALGICEARDSAGKVLYSRPLSTNGQLVPSAATTNVAGWAATCGALKHFLNCNETTGKLS